jgi:hypothetical protein
MACLAKLSTAALRIKIKTFKNSHLQDFFSFGTPLARYWQ